MSFTLRFSKQAAQDIENVLAVTLLQFGEGQLSRYRDLIRQALSNLRADPYAPPAKHRPEIHPDARTFHIARRGKRARHLFVYRVVDPSTIEIARLLHDSMELWRHLPEFGPPDS